MSASKVQALKIVAPVNSSRDLELLHAVGASEFYCGILPQSWVEIYGSSDRLNKRQGLVANLRSIEELLAIQEKACQLGTPVALTLNTSYTREMLPAVLEVAAAWAGAGGSSIMVSDPALALVLAEKHPAVKRCLSILANPFNSGTIQFYRRFGIARVVLPRELGVGEMKTIIERCPDLEFEVMVFNDKCPFIDGLCNFYHSTIFNSGTRMAFEYTFRDEQAEVCAFDPGYAGHGCAILLGRMPSAGNPGCAACYLEKLADAGVGYLKLGGRGLPPSQNARNIRFIRTVIDLLAAGSVDPTVIQALYQCNYGQPCSSEMCYYGEFGG